MTGYTVVQVPEQHLEDLVRRYAGKIEEGLRYVDHQKHTADGRLDSLLADSGNALVVAELKVVQDEGMLLQGLDYLDYVSDNIESFTRLYKDFSIDPTQKVRLFLIAPTFSQTLINRCKWLTPQISLYMVTCVKIDGLDDIIPIFTEQPISAVRPVIEAVKLEDHLAYIKDDALRAQASSFLDEIKGWSDKTSVDSVVSGISIKVNNKLFAYLYERRKHYIITTFDTDGVWKDFPVRTDEELAAVRPLVKSSMEQKMK